MGLLGAITGNLKELDTSAAMEQYGGFLVNGEIIEHAYQLVRDVVIFTDKRMIDIDLQGVTGKKKRIHTIFYKQIINISAETAGRGFDDSELDIYYKEHERDTHVHHRKLEFPKKFEIEPLYVKLMELSMENQK